MEKKEVILKSQLDYCGCCSANIHEQNLFIELFKRISGNDLQRVDQQPSH